MSFYVYILASRRNGTLYIGMTDDLIRRIWQHREGDVPGFTAKYGVKMLVWYEQHETRETQAQPRCHARPRLRRYSHSPAISSSRPISRIGMSHRSRSSTTVTPRPL